MGFKWEDNAKAQAQLVESIRAALTQDVKIQIDSEKLCTHFRESFGVDKDKLSDRSIKDQFTAWKKKLGLFAMKGTGPKAAAKKATEGPDGGPVSGEGEGEDSKEAKKGTKRKRAPAKTMSPKKAKVAKGQDIEESSEKAKIDGKDVSYEDKMEGEYEGPKARGIPANESDAIAHSFDARGEY